VEDHQIIELYFARDELAIEETAKRYGGVCMQVSMDILQDRMDAEECVSDTWLQTWRTIPPQRPTILKAFLCRITRNLSINRLRERKAKRRDRDMTLSLEELEGVLSIPEDKSEGLSELISEFLRSLDREDRLLFMGRYWHGQSVKELADRMGLSANAAAVRLHRIREELRDFLTERGITV
jgi:RNA polymerase sigma-70 factor (ECF subfamily)